MPRSGDPSRPTGYPPKPKLKKGDIKKITPAANKFTLGTNSQIASLDDSSSSRCRQINGLKRFHASSSRSDTVEQKTYDDIPSHSTSSHDSFEPQNNTERNKSPPDLNVVESSLDMKDESYVCMEQEKEDGISSKGSDASMSSKAGCVDLCEKKNDPHPPN